MSTQISSRSIESSPASPTQQRGIARCRPLATILVGFLVSQVYVWLFSGLARHHQFSFFLGTVAAAVLLLSIWLWTTRSVAQRVRFWGTIGSLAVMLVAFKSVKSDGFEGDGTPIKTWRWMIPVRTLNTSAPANVLASQTSGLPDLPEMQAAGSHCDYPGFLGSDRSATLRDVRLATDWKARPPRLLWHQPVGQGWSAFAIAGNRAVTQEQRGSDECTVCYDLHSGRQLWEHRDLDTRFTEYYGGDGPRATPTIYQGRIYSLGGTGILNCLEATTGQRVWSSDTLHDAGAEHLAWGMSGSPLVFDDLVVVNPGGQNDRSVVAYDRHTGEPTWHAGEGQASYSSPMLATMGGVQQVVMLNGPALAGYDAYTGRPLWNYPWLVNGSAMCSISQPVILQADGKPDRVFISAGYGKGCALVELSRSGSEFAVSEAWTPNKSLHAKFTNVVARNGFAYGLDGKILACVDLETGKRRWKGGRYGHGQLILVDDLLLIQVESGEVALVKATAEGHQELSRFAPLSFKTWNNPALAGRLLLVRNDREAACYELPLLDD